MKIDFELNYLAHWGETLAIFFRTDKKWQQILMQCEQNVIWRAELSIADTCKELHYYYAVLNEQNDILRQESDHFQRCVPCNKHNLYLKDSWLDRQWEIFTSKCFTDVFFNQKRKANKEQNGNIEFKVLVPYLEPSQSVGIIGNCSELGHWGEKSIVPLSNSSTEKKYDPLWTLKLSLHTTENIEYKYVIFETDTHKIVDFESRANRVITPYHLEKTCLVNDGFFQYSQPKWQGAGVVVPLFSLKSKHNFGIGEYNDLTLLCDWCNQTNLQIIQLLPINDTTNTLTDSDSYPYSPNSVFALHPMYLNIPTMGKLSAELAQQYEHEKTELQKTDKVPYAEILQKKQVYFDYLFATYAHDLFLQDDFRHFFKANKFWLESYATFMNRRFHREKEFYFFLQYHCHQQLEKAVQYCHNHRVALKGDICIGVASDSADVFAHPHLFDKTVTVGAPPDFFSQEGQNWGFPAYNWEAIEKEKYAWWKERLQVLERYFDAYRIDHILGFFRIWQIPIDKQKGTLGFFNPSIPYTMNSLKKIGLKLSYARLTQSFNGDLNDVLFVTHPQNSKWLYPRINVQQTESFFALKSDEKEIMERIHHEFYYVKNDEFWKANGLKKLDEIIASTSMLCCGEDLGMIPSCVPQVLRQLSILSLEIERLSKDPSQPFTDVSKIPYFSICTSGTHDMPTLNGWWQEEKELRQTFYEQHLHLKNDCPQTINPDLARLILERLVHSNAVLTIIPIQDWLALTADYCNQKDDRINNPANPKQVWNYKIPCSMEELLADKDLTQIILSKTKKR